MDLQQPKKIIKEIVSRQKNINSVVFVGCGASKADLYPAKYFLENCSRTLKVSHYTANEFNYDPPAFLSEKTIVVSASLSGTTPETVKANETAKAKNAHIISLTNDGDSALAKSADYVIVHRFSESYEAKLEKMGYALALAVETVQQLEGYEHYEDMIAGFEKIYTLAQSSAESAKKFAKEFAENYKDAPVVYVVSSGASMEVAYSTSICLMMEMQWINSGYVNSGDFFHGPLEIVEKGVPFILMMNDGPTRHLDARVLTFLNRFNAKVTVIDALDYGLSSVIPKSVCNYFNPMLMVAVFRVYAEELANVRKHPLTKRRYMWKLKY